MKSILIYFLLLNAFFYSCEPKKEVSICSCEASNEINNPRINSVSGLLVSTRFQSLEELKTVITIEYINSNNQADSTIHSNSKVILKHCSNGKEITAVLTSGISQNEISKAQLGSVKDQLHFTVISPFSVAIRKDLEKIFLLARLRPVIFGEGDVAFFDIAKSTVKNINTPALAFKYPKDTTEKGFINTFNHITAQAFITSCFSEELADFVADAHERANDPQLILGKFSEKKLHDLEEGPVDNYVDIINNEWGQELGKQLKEKYHISRTTTWTPELLSNYLNDMQAYYSWALQIGFKPVLADDEYIIKFSRKLNMVMNGF